MTHILCSLHGIGGLSDQELEKVEDGCLLDNVHSEVFVSRTLNSHFPGLIVLACTPGGISGLLLPKAL